MVFTKGSETLNRSRCFACFEIQMPRALQLRESQFYQNPQALQGGATATAESLLTNTQVTDP